MMSPAGEVSRLPSLIVAIPQDLLHLKQCIIRDSNIYSFYWNNTFRRATREVEADGENETWLNEITESQEEKQNWKQSKSNTDSQSKAANGKTQTHKGTGYRRLKRMQHSSELRKGLNKVSGKYVKTTNIKQTGNYKR